MRKIRAFVFRVLGMFRRTQLDREFDEELQSNLEFDIQDGLRSGLSPAEARRQALLRLGGVQAAKEAHRERRSLPAVETLARDVVFAVRLMRSQPAFSAAVVMTLALGSGAATAIFTAVDQVLLRPLPYAQPSRLVHIGALREGTSTAFSYTANFASFRDGNRTLSEIAAWMQFGANVIHGESSERVLGGLATRSLFDLVGVQPVLGRLFTTEEDAPGGPPVVLLSYAFWRDRMGADPSVLRQNLVLDGQSHTILGVLPDGFRVPNRFGGSAAEIWIPFAIQGRRAARGEILAHVTGRLRDGVTLEQASLDLDRLKMKLRSGISYRVVVTRWQDEVAGPLRTPLLILSAAVAFLVLIACANVANLQLSRAASREREFAVRRAIGAGRGRIFQQLLTESLLLASLGGMLGGLLAYAGKNLLTGLLAIRVQAADVALDWRVMLFSSTLTLATGVVCGIAPALHLQFRENLSGALKAMARGMTEGITWRRFRSALVVGEVAAAMLLLTGAGLLVRSFIELRTVDMGYRAGNILTFKLELTKSKYKDTRSQAAYFGQVLEQVGRLPGVQLASLAQSPPFTQYTLTLHQAVIDGLPPKALPVRANVITPDYFRLLDIAVVRGRDASSSDSFPGAAPVAFVNETFARLVCPGGECLGRRVQSWSTGRDWLTIVGVVRDVRTVPGREAEPEVYGLYSQFGGTHATVLLSTVGDPLAVAGVVQRTIAAIDRTQPAYDPETLEQSMSGYLKQRRARMMLVVVFASAALLLGAIGIYGVLSYAVKRRTNEIGVRMALGAEQRNVLGMVLRSGCNLVIAGIAIGMALSFPLMRFLASELWGVRPNDPATLAVVAALLTGTGVLASLVPALRAARIDPIQSLRCE
ncbi:MAG: ABC transporter permease [Bryobacterales bacterium]|nr:ABC transporter permease [Bryobacterales bacterium]